jgi:electron transfer flavoprotein alpha subunit
VNGDKVMTDCRDVLIYGEVTDRGLASITKELLNGGKQLAESLGEELHVVFAGHSVYDRAREACTFGAQKTYVVEDPSLGSYSGDTFVACLKQVVERLKPRILLFGHSEVGADLGPRLAFKMEQAISTDCVALEIEKDSKTLIRTKPVYGGLAMAVFASDGFPQVATVRAKSMNPAEKTGPGGGEPTRLDVDLGKVTERVRVLGRVTEETKGVKLEDAEVIVSGGRGMGGTDGFEALKEMGTLVNGAIGGSRVAVDNGWIPTSLQVGLTGTIVAPRVYIAVGISGASQHMTGCAHSQRIIAINKDAAAPIFTQAHFGVVGDWRTIIPAFVEKLRELG